MCLHGLRRWHVLDRLRGWNCWDLSILCAWHVLWNHGGNHLSGLHCWNLPDWNRVDQRLRLHGLRRWLVLHCERGRDSRDLSALLDGLVFWHSWGQRGQCVSGLPGGRVFQLVGQQLLQAVRSGHLSDGHGHDQQFLMHPLRAGHVLQRAGRHLGLRLQHVRYRDLRLVRWGHLLADVHHLRGGPVFFGRGLDVPALPAGGRIQRGGGVVLSVVHARHLLDRLWGHNVHSMQRRHVLHCDEGQPGQHLPGL